MWRKIDEAKPSPPGISPSPEPFATRPSSLGEPRPEVTRVSKGITLKGEISGREDLFIDGELHGSVRLSDANVVVGPNGRVTADIEASEILVEGNVKGNLRGRDRVQIRSTGWVTGDVVTRCIVIEEGAYLKGSVDLIRPEEPSASLPPKVAASPTALRPVSLGAKDKPK